MHFYAFFICQAEQTQTKAQSQLVSTQHQLVNLC